MKVKNTIATSIFGFLFSLAILFPCIVQFTHFFEEHENVVEAVQNAEDAVPWGGGRSVLGIGRGVLEWGA